MMMARSARTAQGPHDLEMQFDEFRSIGGSYDLLACTSSQLLYRQIYRKKRQLQSTLPELGEWQHMNENVSKISDNYIGDGIVAFAEGKERHINQWCEQNILAPEKVEMDHHCKRSSRIRQSGAVVAPNRYTVLNIYGQRWISVLTETTSYSDASLVAAHDARVLAAISWGQPWPRRSTCDNPHKDGNGIQAHMRRDLPLFRFAGEIDLTVTREECITSCARLASSRLLGFDTERIAYIKEHAKQGVSSNKAAVVQVGDGQYCALFLVHLWSEPYEEFKQLMASSNVEKVACCVQQDGSSLRARFPGLVIEGLVELRTMVKAKFPALGSYNLKSMVRKPQNTENEIFEREKTEI